MWVVFALFFTRLAFAHTGLGCVMGYSGFPSFLYALVRVCIMSVYVCVRMRDCKDDHLGQRFFPYHKKHKEHFS